ncbi:MAG: kelch repeat-containing protein [Methanoregula sp.]
MRPTIILAVLLCISITGIVSAGTSSYETWTEISGNASFSPRESHSVTVFDNRLWVIGGRVDPSDLANDVWSSSDGKNWSLETVHAGFSPRTYHSVVVFNNKLWVIGGSSIDGYMNDVWSSPDGRAWTRETEHAGFSPRCRHGVTVFDNRLWTIGGSHLENGFDVFTDDVWSSADGKKWNLETDHAGFGPRWGTGAVAFDNRLWVLAGNLTSDVWSSPDGKNWTLIDGSAPFSSTGYNGVTVFGNKLIVVGNFLEGHGFTNDIWSSPDGKEWSFEKVNGDFGVRPGNKVVAFNNGLWAIGGFDSLRSGRDKNDVWYIPLTVQTTATTVPPTSAKPSPVPDASAATPQAGIDPLTTGISLLILIVTGYCVKRKF